MSGRRRLDLVLVERGLAPSRSRAAALIEAGRVRLDGETVRQNRRHAPPDAALEIEPAPIEYVSRGAVKLAAALDHFAVSPAGLAALDIGASTGGFTQMLLVRGAARVYAVDVGHGQLDPSLRADPRVCSLERTNARTLSAEIIPEPAGFVTCDASFIGLETVLPAPLALAAPGAILIALIKPQFEVGPGGVGKGGIVRDPGLVRAVLGRIEAWLASRPGWRVEGLIESPITGSDGNREFLICARHTG